MDTVKVKEFIICTKTRRGKGVSPLSPVRIITEVFDFDGNLIAENDPHNITIESFVDFINYRFTGIEKDKILEWMQAYFMHESD